ncbi:MAG: hypothetical protein D6820_08105 [Lentisphaerae bacterium]|nr:MAG: hypothetical protein D6820_08105 [Lentisphaerota bacterium]
MSTTPVESNHPTPPPSRIVAFLALSVLAITLTSCVVVPRRRPLRSRVYVPKPPKPVVVKPKVPVPRPVVVTPRLPAVTVVTVRPPAPRVETRPPMPGRGYVWVAGHWVRQGNKWVWAPGHWVKPPRGHKVWVPGRWVKSGNGWKYVSGHWK